MRLPILIWYTVWESNPSYSRERRVSWPLEEPCMFGASGRNRTGIPLYRGWVLSPLSIPVSPHSLWPTIWEHTGITTVLELGLSELGAGVFAYSCWAMLRPTTWTKFLKNVGQLLDWTSIVAYCWFAVNYNFWELWKRCDEHFQTWL